MDYHYSNKTPLYSPCDIFKLHQKAILEESGDINKFLNNKHRYKQLTELRYASIFALAINKHYKQKYFIQSADQETPDVLFINNNEAVAFPVEIMELFSFPVEPFEENYEKIATKVYEAKGNMDLNQAHLLLVNRYNSKNFNITKFVDELKKFSWKFERIWLMMTDSRNTSFALFEIFPFPITNSIGQILFDFRNEADKVWLY